MKKNLIVFAIGLLVGSSCYWIFRDGPLATRIRESKLVQKVSDVFDDRATSRLKEEMDKEGKITVNKPAGANIAAVSDGLLNDLVKAKVAAEPMLSDASIRTEVSSGEVRLRGSASSYEQVARAIRLAFECAATKTVISTIEVKAK